MQVFKTEKELERIRNEVIISDYVQMFFYASFVLGVLVMAFYSIKP